MFRSLTCPKYRLTFLLQPLKSSIKTMSTVREQPPWLAPSAAGVGLPPLKIYNSLTRSKTPFVPIKAKEKEVSWYACGPTVYDEAHLGHARNFVTTDIIRRILRDYFNFKMQFVMNITDVDDKIILRGRQQHLLTEFVSKTLESRAIPLETATEALKAYLEKNLKLVSPATPLIEIDTEVKKQYANVLAGKSLDAAAVGDREAKLKMHIRTVSSAVEAMTSPEISLDQFFAKAQDILLPYLDSLYGSSIDAEDHSIFTKLTSHYEDRFVEDMRALNCLDPDTLTRVTEFGPQIVDFVKKIEGHGFAYKTTDGSVYFDVDAFEAANNKYPRLEPWSRNDKGRQAEGEGALVQTTSEKKSNSDFALWKASRPGEPSWASPWGKGRPGWHIECSAMASEVIGPHLDIHSGGIDLAFPHHDNELAQSEAYWSSKEQHDQHQWVNYFIHMGHLSIAGSKMSKSLKNFTTIREALTRGDWTSRGLRIVFLLGDWRGGIEVTDGVVKESTTWEDRLDNLFFKVHDLMDRKISAMNTVEPSTDLRNALEKAQKETFDALCDSFNTRHVMLTISELVGTVNSANWKTTNHDDVIAIAKWVTEMVNIFGLNGNASATSDTIGWSGSSIPEEAKAFVYPLSDLRDQLRQKARSAEGITSADLLAVTKLDKTAEDKTSQPYSSISTKFAQDVSDLVTSESKSLSRSVLELCDRLRDTDLWEKGIYLEDSVNANEPALVRPVTRELLAAREGRDQQRLAKQRAKEERERQAVLEAEQKAAQGKISHLEMFRTSEYSQWDVEGLPSKDAEGKDVPKTRLKKLRKDWERQKKLHEAFLASQAK